jgi:uncharacterized protein YjbI with pentapeptide repeats
MNSINLETNDYAGKHFVGLDVAGQTLAERLFEDCDFRGCDLSSATLKQCKLVDCRFVECNLSLLNVVASKFHEVALADCKVIGINWTRATWPRLMLASPLKFRKCILNDSSFFGLNLADIVIEDCKARDVDFREANLSRAALTHTDFENSLFNRTNLTGADFSEATNYDIDVFSNEIKKAKFSRFEAIRLLDSLDIELID